MPRERARALKTNDSILKCEIEHIRTFTQILRAIQLSKRQKVQMQISQRGVQVAALDMSKSLKAQCVFRKETFKRFWSFNDREGGFEARATNADCDDFVVRDGDDDDCDDCGRVGDESRENNNKGDDRRRNDGDEINRRNNNKNNVGGNTTATNTVGGKNSNNSNNGNSNTVRGGGGENNERDEVRRFGISLESFVDVLEMFATRTSSDGDGETLLMSYPDRHGRVALESNSTRETTVIDEHGGRSRAGGALRPLRQTTYADVATEAPIEENENDDDDNTIDAQRGEDGDDRDEFLRLGRAVVTFVLPTTRWKEIVEDLEWTSANVTLIATKDTLAFISESPEIGSMRVDVDLSSLVEYSFREKLGNSTIQKRQKWTYKQDFLKRTTMVPTHSGGGGGGGGQSAFGSSFRQTQTQGGGHASASAPAHNTHHHRETDEAYQATTKISVGETGCLKVAHMLRLRAFGGFGGENSGGGGGNVPVTFVMASILNIDDGMGSDDDEGEEHYEEEEEE